MSDINDYQNFCRTTAQYPNIGNNIEYPTLGLCGEAGEIANKVKKIQRDNDGITSIETRHKLIEELGDVLWYVAQFATEIDIELSEVIDINIQKLSSRMERGMIKGEGDNR